MRIALFKTLQRERFLKTTFHSHYLGFASLKAYLDEQGEGRTDYA